MLDRGGAAGAPPRAARGRARAGRRAGRGRRQTYSPVSLLTRSGRRRRRTPAHRLHHPLVLVGAGVLDRRDRRQVGDHVVGVAAVETVVVGPPLDLAEGQGQQLGGRPGAERVGDAVGPGLAEDLLADLVQLRQVAVAHAGHQRDASGTQHPRHLGDGPPGVGHVVQHVVGDHDVERGRSERQLLDVGHPPGGAR